MYTEIVDNTQAKNLPLVYTIEIGQPEDEFYKFYIGKSSKGHNRPLKKYPKNVSNFESNIFRKSYKNGKIIGKRPAWRKHIHPVLSKAKRMSWAIKLTLDPVDSIYELDVFEQLKLNIMIKKYGIDKTLNIQLVNETNHAKSNGKR